MPGFWTNAKFVPHFFLLIMLVGFATIARVGMSLVSIGDTLRQTNVACQILGTKVSEGKISLNLKCGDITGDYHDADLVINVLTKHIESITCDTYEDRSIGGCKS